MDSREYTFEGATPDIHGYAHVSREATLVGDVTVGPNANVWPGVVLRGDVAPVEVGRESAIGDGAIVHASTVGEKVMVGHGASSTTQRSRTGRSLASTRQSATPPSARAPSSRWEQSSRRATRSPPSRSSAGAGHGDTAVRDNNRPERGVRGVQLRRLRQPRGPPRGSLRVTPGINAGDTRRVTYSGRAHTVPSMDDIVDLVTRSLADDTAAEFTERVDEQAMQLRRAIEPGSSTTKRSPSAWRSNCTPSTRSRTHPSQTRKQTTRESPKKTSTTT